MAVSKSVIKSELSALYERAKNGISDAEFADGLAAVIQSAIVSATVNVTVIGTSATGGPVTGSGTGSLK